MVSERLLLRSRPFFDLNLGLQSRFTRGKVLAEYQRCRPASVGVVAGNFAGLMLRDPLVEIVGVAGVERAIRAAKDINPKTHDIRTPRVRPWFDRLTTNGICHLTTNGICHLTTNGICHLTTNGICHLTTIGICYLTTNGICYLTTNGTAPEAFRSIPTRSSPAACR
jgi:hypothetical protein